MCRATFPTQVFRQEAPALGVLESGCIQIWGALVKKLRMHHYEIVKN